MRGKKVAIAMAVTVLAAVAFLALAPKASPSRLLAPSIFVSYDEDGNESRIFFHLGTESGDVYVDACDDVNFGKSWGRYLEPTSFRYDPAAGEVCFDGMRWKVSGEPGSRVLKNVENDRGVLWGTYYENLESAVSAEPYVYVTSAD